MLFNKKIIFLFFYFFIIIIYPLAYQLNAGDAGVSVNNKFAFFSLLFLMILLYSKEIFFSKKNLIDYLFIWSIFYLTISLLLYASSGVMLLGDIFREVLYSIIPVLFYFMGKSLKSSEIDIFIKSVFFSFFAVIFIAVLNLFDFTFFNIRGFQKGNVLKTFYSAITMGFIAQFMFALVLFKQIRSRYLSPFLLGFFFIISLLTLQRSAFLGVLTALFVFLLFQHAGRLRIIFFTLSSLSILLYFTLTLDLFDVFGFDAGLYILKEFNNFNYTSVAAERASQAVILNTQEFMHIFLGEGFGKYSPNNTLSKLIMPDAAFYRIYNELGIIGGLSFFLPFILLFTKAIKDRNAFEIYFIGFSLIAFFFNRIIWMIPLNYIFFTFLGVFENSDYKINSSSNNQLKRHS